MTDEDRISSKLKAFREKSGLSVREIARRLDVPASTYSNYEIRFKGRYLPVIDRAAFSRDGRRTPINAPGKRQSRKNSPHSSNPHAFPQHGAQFFFDLYSF